MKPQKYFTTNFNAVQNYFFTPLSFMKNAYLRPKF